MTDYVLAWIMMEDDGIRQHTETLFTQRSQSIRNIEEILVDFMADMGKDDEIMTGTDSAFSNRREALARLVGYLRQSTPTSYNAM